MRKSIGLAAAFALAACNGTASDETDAPETAQADAGAAVDSTDPDADAGFEAVAPGNYEVRRADGKIDQLTILPGMTWAMVFSDGEPAGGTIFAQGGKNCFVTEGVEGHRCFSGTAPAADGSMTVTGDDGETAIVKPSAS